MKVGIGITVLMRCLQTSSIDGIAGYTRELLSRLSEDKDIELAPFSFGYRLSDHASFFPNPKIAPPFVPFAVVSSLTGLPFPGIDCFSGGKPDVIHATDHLIPKAGRIPLVATLMDAVPLSHPEWVSNRLRRFKNFYWKKTASWADHVITISNHSKLQIQEHFGLPSDRISIIPLGVDDRWFHPLPAQFRLEVTARLKLPSHFFLFVGTLQPRKNVDRVIQAYLTLPAAIKEEIPLLIVGRNGWRSDHLVSALSNGRYGPSVRWLRHLPDKDLHAVLKMATALIFPSLCEGFGLPVLEAFASQTPVITSNTSALPEVAGDAAMLVNPEKTDEIALAMEKLAQDSEQADQLRQKGLARAKGYSWSRTAKMTIEIYQKVAGK